MGIQRSKSVAKVEIKSKKKVNVGTGFLFSIEGSDQVFFMTNHHVISDKINIKNTKIIFNFEKNLDGETKTTKSFDIKENGIWQTSPVNELDITFFQLDDTKNLLKEFNFLNLNKIEILKNDFVNIIQHPAGEPKQISLYHNIVTNVDNNKVQYLTDTLQGSSGSPVFNSDWEVVAIHHSGGKKKKDEPELPMNIKSRNEGIHINYIIDFIKSKL